MTKVSLTKREKQILTALVEGKSNPEISKEFEISTNTVKSHCKSIFEKLDVDSRVDAVVKALSEGFIFI